MIDSTFLLVLTGAAMCVGTLGGFWLGNVLKRKFFPEKELISFEDKEDPYSNMKPEKLQ